MRGRNFNRFLLPIAVTDRKAAANAIAAGVLIGTILALLSGAAAAIVGLRHGDAKTTLVLIIFDADSCPRSAMVTRILTKTTKRSKSADGQPTLILPINWKITGLQKR